MATRKPAGSKVKRNSRVKMIVVSALAVLIVVPATFGFGYKLYEFFQTLTADADGRFAIYPIMNYVLVTTGFACILVWAIAHGMFRDIEKPKYTMMEREGRIDQADQLAEEQST